MNTLKNKYKYFTVFKLIIYFSKNKTFSFLMSVHLHDNCVFIHSLRCVCVELCVYV